MSALMMSITNAAHDGVDSLQCVDAQEEMSVVRTPKTMVAALVVAVVAGMIAYQQAPASVDARVSRSVAPVHEQSITTPVLQAGGDASAQVSLQGPIDPIEAWASIEAAPMSPALEG